MQIPEFLHFVNALARLQLPNLLALADVATEIAISLRLRFKDALSEAAIIGNDLVRASQMFIFPVVMIQALSSLIAGVLFLLAVDVGAVALIGLGTMVAVLFITAKVGSRSRKAQKDMAAAADVTLASMRELIEGSRVVKLQV